MFFTRKLHFNVQISLYIINRHSLTQLRSVTAPTIILPSSSERTISQNHPILSNKFTSNTPDNMSRQFNGNRAINFPPQPPKDSDDQITAFFQHDPFECHWAIHYQNVLPLSPSLSLYRSTNKRRITHSIKAFSR